MIEKHIRIDEDDCYKIESILDGRPFSHFIRELIKDFFKRRKYAIKRKENGKNYRVSDE